MVLSVLVFVSFLSCISLCPAFIARLAQGWSVIGVGHITVDDFDAGGRLHPSTYPVPSHLINLTVSAQVLFILDWDHLENCRPCVPHITILLEFSRNYGHLVGIESPP
jgi:hypothetical protein